MAAPNKKSKSERLICLCNGVSQETIEKAIENGCRTLSRIFDATGAGVGACGGSCQPTLKKMLETFERTGRFPENPRPPSNRRKLPK
jgi:bacterioferritin-associated ferredoxin